MRETASLYSSIEMEAGGWREGGVLDTKDNAMIIFLFDLDYKRCHIWLSEGYAIHCVFLCVCVNHSTIILSLMMGMKVCLLQSVILAMNCCYDMIV